MGKADESEKELAPHDEASPMARMPGTRPRLSRIEVDDAKNSDGPANDGVTTSTS